MSGPAVEAAQRAWTERYPNGSVLLASSAYQDGIGALAIAAAREALKPVQAKCEELDRLFGDSSTYVAIGVRRVLQDLAPLIYTTEELER